MVITLPFALPAALRRLPTRTNPWHRRVPSSSAVFRYVLPFKLPSLILLAAMVGAIVLARQTAREEER